MDFCVLWCINAERVPKKALSYSLAQSQEIAWMQDLKFAVYVEADFGNCK